jgi:hypothetical protein
MHLFDGGRVSQPPFKKVYNTIKSFVIELSHNLFSCYMYLIVEIPMFFSYIVGQSFSKYDFD